MSLHKKIITLIFICINALTFLNCGPASPPGSEGKKQQAQNELTSCTEDDLPPMAFVGPLAGKDGALVKSHKGDFIAVTTHMKVRMQSQEGMGAFQQVMKALQQAMPKAQGLLASSFSFSQKCGYARTLTIWKDYDSMMTFVVAKEHADAMIKAPKIASHFRTMHWSGGQKEWPVNWDDAKRRLTQITMKTYK